MKFNPYVCSQAALVFNQALLDIPDGDIEALTRFNADPQSPERLAFAKLFETKVIQSAGQFVETELLAPVGIHSLDAIARFDSAEHFCKDNAHGIKFYFGSDFEKNFIGKVEEGIPACELMMRKLKKDSRDTGIRKEIGPDKEETFLGQMLELLKLQPQGQEGVLLANGYANIFYIRDKNGKLWAVRASRGGGGWYVSAHSVGYPYGWRAGDQVVSR